MPLGALERCQHGGVDSDAVWRAPDALWARLTGLEDGSWPLVHGRLRGSGVAGGGHGCPGNVLRDGFQVKGRGRMMNRWMVNGCLIKPYYETRQAAEAVYNKRPAGKKVLRIYRCTHGCGFWHIGHKKERRGRV